MSVQIIRGNALDLPLADDSVDLIVTSPPYFGLRSYQDGGTHYDGQIGSEATPAEFVDALIAATREMVRVVKPSGSIWVNLGDKYAGSNGQSGGGGKSTLAGAANARARGDQQEPKRGGFVAGGAPAKSLIGIPWRYAIRCIDDLGLILRAEVIWSKPNGLPESVTDRVRRSHEVWFHFTLNPRYYSAVDEIREAQAQASIEHARRYGRDRLGDSDQRFQQGTTLAPNPLGKLPGSVWTIPTQPLTVPAHLGVDHFAAFPMEWPRRIVSGWSPRGVCEACGEGRRPVVHKEQELLHVQNRTRGLTDLARPNGEGGGVMASGSALPVTRSHTTITGEACACPDTTAPTRPGTVLDPFGGTGTTALVAHALGRHGISVDMSADYCRLAEWRTTDPGQIAAAMQVEKPAPVMDGQLDIFGEAV